MSSGELKFKKIEKIFFSENVKRQKQPNFLIFHIFSGQNRFPQTSF